MSEFDVMVDTPGPEDQISVMICESSQVQLRILRQAVEEAGYRVQTARSAETVMEMLQVMPVDILLTGIEVGTMTGLEACWALKANPRTESVHTIIITASGQESRLEESLDAGAYDFIRKPVNMTELRARLRAATRLVRMQKQFRRLAETDALTGIANRRALMQCLETTTVQARSRGTQVAVVMLDLDHFKRVNDTHGHAVGDRVLVETVRAVQTCLPGRERLGRLGGEEFIVVLPDATPEFAAIMAERIRQKVEAQQIVNNMGEAVPVTASIGVAISTNEDGHDTPDALLLAADNALYHAKESGRNRVVFADAVMRGARRAAG